MVDRWTFVKVWDVTTVMPVEAEEAMVFVLLYDITARKTFEGVHRFIRRVKRKQDRLVFLVGSKADCKTGGREVRWAEGKELANLYGFKFLEFSDEDERSDLFLTKCFPALELQDLLRFGVSPDREAWNRRVTFVWCIRQCSALPREVIQVISCMVGWRDQLDVTEWLESIRGSREGGKAHRDKPS